MYSLMAVLRPSFSEVPLVASASKSATVTVMSAPCSWNHLTWSITIEWPRCILPLGIRPVSTPKGSFPSMQPSTTSRSRWAKTMPRRCNIPGFGRAEGSTVPSPNCSIILA